ncbi:MULTISPECIES: hypothetical protein [unclassified Flavobacterium]|jgi:uncharacterized protein YcfL|uniref:hypothetical protein n=1 Tax=unclassified Flavobacterium TaxID=196869 RepID=UPI0025B94BDD|nr:MULTISPECIES: hypothetical protein [unclassified Flavobacterium]
MKNIKYLIYLGLLTLASCGVHSEVQMSNIMDKTYIGMSESEFKEKVVGEENVKMDTTISIYKVTVSSNRYIEGWTHKTRFFYFSNNKLVQVDEGERAVDYRIKVD